MSHSSEARSWSHPSLPMSYQHLIDVTNLAHRIQLLKQSQQQQQQTSGSLRDILKPEIVGPILRNKEVRDRLLVHLPEEHRETADLEELIQTPQFKSQLERFSEALQSGQMDLGQFGLKSETNSPIADLRTFLKAIQDQVKEKEGYV